jgi:hypothetical protein
VIKRPLSERAKSVQPGAATLGNSPMWKNLMLPVRARPAFRWVPQIDMKAYDFDCTNFRKTLGSLVISSTTVILVWLKSGNVGSEVPKPFSLPQVTSV